MRRSSADRTLDRRSLLFGSVGLALSGRAGAQAATPFADAKSEKCFARADIPRALAPRYDDLVRRIHLEVWKPENEFRPGDTVQSIASRLGAIADKASAFARASDKLSLDLIRAEALAAWIRSNMEPWSEINSRPGLERVEWNRPERVLSHTPRPKGNCDGFSRLTTAIGKAMGLKAVGIGGVLRRTDGSIPSGGDTKWVHGVPWNHGWNAFLIGEKVAAADLSAAWRFLEGRFRTSWKGKTDGCHAIPLDRDEWEVFLATHWTLHWDGKIIPDDPLQNRTLDSWKSHVVQHVERLRTDLRLRDTRRNERLLRYGVR